MTISSRLVYWNSIDCLQRMYQFFRMIMSSKIVLTYWKVKFLIERSVQIYVKFEKATKFHSSFKMYLSILTDPCTAAAASLFVIEGT